LNAFPSFARILLNTSLLPKAFNGDKSNYEVLDDLTATLTIDKATYELSEVYFESGIFKYDGNSKKIEISGDLPLGVTVSYFVYSQNLEVSYDEFPIEIGTYVVIARFSHNNSNYLEINDMHAIIIIES
jgi:hypothetical protein